MALTAYARPNLSGIPSDYVPVTPDDDNDNCGDACTGVYVTTAGDVSVVFVGGETVRVITLPAFGTLIGTIARVRATDTTATGIHAMQG